MENAYDFDGKFIALLGEFINLYQDENQVRTMRAEEAKRNGNLGIGIGNANLQTSKEGDEDYIEPDNYWSLSAMSVDSYARIYE